MPWSKARRAFCRGPAATVALDAPKANARHVPGYPTRRDPDAKTHILRRVLSEVLSSGGSLFRQKHPRRTSPAAAAPGPRPAPAVRRQRAHRRRLKERAAVEEASQRQQALEALAAAVGASTVPVAAEAAPGQRRTGGGP
jgi:hypothetical protein